MREGDETEEIMIGAYPLITFTGAVPLPRNFINKLVILSILTGSNPSGFGQEHSLIL